MRKINGQKVAKGFCEDIGKTIKADLTFSATLYAALLIHGPTDTKTKGEKKFTIDMQPTAAPATVGCISIVNIFFT